jgi:hypothetical protein
MIDETIARIVRQCGPLASAGTRYNGLSVLRKIGKTICLSATDTLGHEVQKDFQWRRGLEEGMVEIVRAMSVRERRGIVAEQVGPEGLWVKLVELDALREEHYVLEQLPDVLSLLRGDGGEEDEDAAKSDSADDDDNHQDRLNPMRFSS